MAYLKYYQEEHQMFKPQSEIQLNNLETQYIFNKFKKRYKLDHYLEFRGYSNSGRCGRRRLRVSHNPTLGVLLHEIGHAVQYKKRMWSDEKLKQRWHGKQHRTIVKRLYRITNPKIEQWKNEANFKSIMYLERIQKREQAIVQKNEQKKTPQYRLEQIQKKIKSWESKKKRAENRLKKLRRIEKIWIKKNKYFG